MNSPTPNLIFLLEPSYPNPTWEIAGSVLHTFSIDHLTYLHPKHSSGSPITLKKKNSSKPSPALTLTLIWTASAVPTLAPGRRPQATHHRNDHEEPPNPNYKPSCYVPSCSNASYSKKNSLSCMPPLLEPHPSHFYPR